MGKDMSVCASMYSPLGNWLITVQACEAYHLPEHISPHVEIVTPSIYFIYLNTIIKKRGANAILPVNRVGPPSKNLLPKTTGRI